MTPPKNHSSSPEERWAKTWHDAGIKLDAIKAEDMRSDDYYERNLAWLDAMLQYALENSVARTDSGLVVMQKILRKGKPHTA